MPVPKDFLKEVPGYVNAVADRVLARRGLLVAYLNANYKIPRGKAEEIRNKVSRDLGKPVLKGTIAADASVYRYAFLYLTDAKQRSRISDMLKRNPSLNCLAGVRGLQKSGIENWEQLEAKVQKPPVSSLSTDAEATKIAAPVSIPIGTSPLEMGQTLLREIIQGANSTRSALDRLSALLESIFGCYKKLAGEVEALKQENANQAEVIRNMSDKMSAMTEAMSMEQATQLRRIAMQSGNEELLQFADELEKGICEQEEEFAKLIDLLPATYDWKKQGSGPVHYEKSFRAALAKLPQGEVQQVAKALANLCAYGPGYSSLESQRIKQEIPNTPKRAMMSRVTREIRFSWQRAGSAVSVLTLYWLWRRGESTTGQRER